ncbi:MAG: hypothetical protein JNM78_13435 [Cyclobacteriaceae bacterium]|nr:hypothetical protein [Cyclobacteriaceae bacterium]
MKIFLLATLMLTTLILNAQNISKETIQWNATGFKDLDANEDVSNSCKFITVGAEKIKWVQDNGKVVVEWNVTSTKGSWTNVTTDGTFTYSFSDREAKGELTTAKTESGWVMDLLIVGGTSDVRLRYTISSITKL